MALTVTTDLTVITTAETATGWTTYGAGGAGALALEPDFFAQGSNCISRGVSGAGTNKGMSFDIGAGNVLNFTTTHLGKLVYIWMRCNTPTLADTRVAGGIRIVLGSGATAPADAAGVWSAWYVDGSETIATETGWKCYVIDPTLAPSTTFGGGVDLTAIRWFGGIMRSTATAKGQNFGIDQISYGFGELRCHGTNTTAGAGFAEMLAADYGTATNRYGIMTERGGIIYIQGKLVIGDSISTNTTNFSSQNESLVWERRTYYDGTRESPCVRDIIQSTSVAYHGLFFRGNGTGDTNVTLGVKVGTGDTASGRSGPTFIGHRGKVEFSFDDGNVETVLIYGATFSQLRGGINMSGNSSSDEFIGNVISGSGSFQAGPVKVRGCNFVDNIGGSSLVFEDFQNDAVAAEALATADPLKRWTAYLNGANWSCPTKVQYVELLDPGASDQISTIIQDAVTGTSQIDVNAGTGVYTPVFSPSAVGFRVGDTVTFSGFSNAGNNGNKVILSVTGGVFTVATAGLVTETGSGDETAVAPYSSVTSPDHYAEAVIRWPSAGANQGALGVVVRANIPVVSDYYYLKCDLVAGQITLIRSDSGSDTTIAGPTSFSFAEDTDYLIRLEARGSNIDGFVNGTKISATGQTSFPLFMRVGIRGNAEADQTGDAPRLSKFASGNLTDKVGAIVVSSANDDFGYSNFINNSRALNLQTTGTYSSTNNNFSGNLVDIRDDSSGATTINVTGTGGAPLLSKTEEVDDAVTTINASVVITVTVKDVSGVALQNARVAVYTDNSSEIELMNELTDINGIATESYAFSGDQPIFIRVRAASGNPAYLDIEANGTITSSGLTAQITMQVDPNV